MRPSNGLKSACACRACVCVCVRKRPLCVRKRPLCVRKRPLCVRKRPLCAFVIFLLCACLRSRACLGKRSFVLLSIDLETENTGPFSSCPHHDVVNTRLVLADHHVNLTRIIAVERVLHTCSCKRGDHPLLKTPNMFGRPSTLKTPQSRFESLLVFVFP